MIFYFIYKNKPKNVKCRLCVLFFITVKLYFGMRLLSIKRYGLPHKRSKKAEFFKFIIEALIYGPHAEKKFRIDRKFRIGRTE